MLWVVAGCSGQGAGPRDAVADLGTADPDVAPEGIPDEAYEASQDDASGGDGVIGPDETGGDAADGAGGEADGTDPAGDDAPADPGAAEAAQDLAEDPGEDAAGDEGEDAPGDPGGDAAADAGIELPPDDCPDDPLKTEPGECGCGVPDTPNCAEVDPPVPDPPGWAVAPHAIGKDSIAMVAETVADASGVEYFFECAAGPCHDSGWRDGAAWVDAGLAPDMTCAYRVKARDRSANLNETGWSGEAIATTDRDPGFAAGIAARYFDLGPAAASLPEMDGLAPDVERVEAQVTWAATGEPWTGLPPGFADGFASRHAGFIRIEVGGEYAVRLDADQGARMWLDSEPVLDAGGADVFASTVAVRQLAPGYHPIRIDHWEDTGPAALVLSWSGPGFGTEAVPRTALYHADPPDAQQPAPSPAAWEMPPSAAGPAAVTMTAAAASDPAGVRYAFECVLGCDAASGWRTGRTWEVAGLEPGTMYAFRFRAADLSLAGNASAPSPTGFVTTDTYVPDVVGMPRPLAEAAIADAALLLGEVAEAWDDVVPAGSVAAQGPAAGTPLPAGSKVWLTVSLGVEPVPVPDVTGMKQADAEVAIAAARLAVGGVTTVPSCTGAPGTVTGQQPGGGWTAPKGSPVTLFVSRGPEQVVVNELMYHPPDDDVAREEWVELFNPCAWPAAVAGWTIDGLGDFAFPAGAAIPAGGYVVVAEDAAAFEAAWGFPPDFTYAGASLANGGETLVLTTAAGVVADQVTYDDVPPWPVTPDGLGPSIEVIDPSKDNGVPRNWHASIAPAGGTPRAPNSVLADGLPPWITLVRHDGPEPGIPIRVVATVRDATAVTLAYRIGWGAPATVPMKDDGLSGDGAPGDGEYGAAIPGQPTGTLVRYRIDASGPTGEMGYPRDDDTLEWVGTYLAPPVASDLDVFHWLIHPDDYARALSHVFTDETEPALLFHNGVLYDGLRIRVRGQSSRGWPKKHWNFKFPQGHGFRASGFTMDPVSGFNLQSSYADKSYLREVLSYETFGAAGSPTSVARHVTVWQNGQFFGLYTYLEDRDAGNLERSGLDPEGALYKAFSSQCQYQTIDKLKGPWEKMGPPNGDFSDLHSFLAGANNLTGQARKEFLFDNCDVPAMLSYHAASVVIHNNDQVAKNYFLYRDTHGTGRWWFLAWDMDLTFGRMFQNTVLNDQLFADTDVVAGRANVSPSHPLFGDSEHQKWDYLWNRVTDALLEDPDIREMYYRRLRTLMDELLVEGRYEARIDELAALTADEAEADRVRWGWYGTAETPATAVSRMKAEYLARRRTHLFATHRIDGGIPPAQSAHPAVVINELMYKPWTDPLVPDDPRDELEFVELYNPSPHEAVDLTGWTVAGVGMTIPSGAVILPEAYMLLVRNDAMLRAGIPPGRHVGGQYGGKLDGGGERVALIDRTGFVVDEVEYDDVAPWPIEADGGGASLELRDPALDNSLPESWKASAVAGGTPGAPNSP